MKDNHRVGKVESCVLILATVGVFSGIAHADDQEIFEESILFPDPQISGEFGTSLAFENGVLVVGAINQPASIIDLGTLSPTDIVYPVNTDSDSLFGFDIEIDDGIMAVSASFEGIHDPESGAVYLYDIATGQQTHRLAPTEGEGVIDFGLSLAMDNGQVIVGSMNGFHVFDAATGAVLNSFAISEQTQFFGNASEAVDGKLIIGAPGENSIMGFDTGAVYIYDINTGVELMKITANDATASAHFGDSLAVDDGMIVIGAPGAENGQGGVYVFDVETGMEITKLDPIAQDGFAGPRFGQALDIDNGVIVVGTPNGRDDENLFGMVQLFDATSGIQTSMLRVRDPLNNARRFGYSVLIESGLVVVGAIDTSTALIFDLSSGECVADFNSDGDLNFFDITDFISALGSENPASDLNGDDEFNFFDVSMFLGAFSQGCP